MKSESHHEHPDRHARVAAPCPGWCALVVGAALGFIPALAMAQGGGGGIDEVDMLLEAHKTGLPNLPDPYEWRNSTDPPRYRGTPTLPQQPALPLETFRQPGADLLDDQVSRVSLLALRTHDGPALSTHSSAIPEPSTLALFAGGLVLLAVRRR